MTDLDDVLKKEIATSALAVRARILRNNSYNSKLDNYICHEQEAEIRRNKADLPS